MVPLLFLWLSDTKPPLIQSSFLLGTAALETNLQAFPQTLQVKEGEKNWRASSTSQTIGCSPRQHRAWLAAASGICGELINMSIDSRIF